MRTDGHCRYDQGDENSGDPEPPEHADLQTWYGSDFDASIPDRDDLGLKILKLAERWMPLNKRLS